MGFRFRCQDTLRSTSEGRVKQGPNISNNKAATRPSGWLLAAGTKLTIDLLQASLSLAAPTTSVITHTSGQISDTTLLCGWVRSSHMKGRQRIVRAPGYSAAEATSAFGDCVHTGVL